MADDNRKSKGAHEDFLRKGETHNDLFRLLFESSQDAILVETIDGRILKANRAACEMFGYDRPELLKLTAYDLAPNPDHEFINDLKSCLPDNSTLQMQAVRKDGRKFAIDVRSSRVKVDGREILFVTIRDISAIKETRQKLLESEERFRSYIENSPDGIFVVDGKGNYIEVNQAACRDTGYSREELLKLNTMDIGSPDDSPVALNSFKNLKQSGEISVEVIYRKKDKTTGWWNLRAIKLSDDRFIAFCRDITNRKQLEEELDRQRLILSEAERMAKIGAWEWDLKTNKLTFTDEWLKIHGVQYGQMSPEELMPIAHPDDRKKILKAWDDAIKGKRDYDIEHRIINQKTKNVHTVKAYGKIVRDQEGQPVRMYGTAQDITDRKKSEEKLQSAIRDKALLVDMGSEMFAYYDLDLRIQWANKASADSVGLSADELHGRHCYKIWHCRSEPCENCPVLEARETGKLCEREIQSPDGRHWYLRGYPIKDDNGKVIALAEFGQDITDRKMNELAIKESEQKFRAVFENAPYMMLLIDSETGQIADFNDRTHETYGYTREEFEKFSVSDIEASETPEEIDKHIKLTLARGHDSFPTKHRTKAGHILDIQVNIKVIEKEGRKYFVSIWDDITERKRAEKALRESEAKYRSLVESLPLGVALIATDMRVISMNKKLREWFPEYKEHEPQVCYKILQSPETGTMCQDCPIKKTFRTGEAQDKTVQAIILGRKRDLRMISKPVKDSDDNLIGAIKIVEDITDKLRMEKELNRAEKLESVGILAGGIAYDFNNILSAILGNLSLLRSDLSHDDEIMKLLGEAERASIRARNLTQQLLTFSKGGTPILRPTTIENVIKDSAKFALRGSNSGCKFDFPENLKPVEADESQISQVIGNLVLNADQSMPEGGIINIRASNVTMEEGAATSLEAGDYVMISVRDNGCGIPEKYLNRVFDPFFTTKERGNGLGLASCYSIIKKHGGTIQVKSEFGQGSEFCFYLPCSNKPPENKKPISRPLIHGHGRILVMDDDSSIRRVAQVALPRLGYDVTVAENGEDAITLYKQALDQGSPYDAVIMDLTIPGGMGGKEALSHLVEIDPGVKAIVSSGYSNDPVLANHQNYGFCGCLIKPFIVQDLAQTLHHVMNNPVQA